jgi:hypothetical protein
MEQLVPDLKSAVHSIAAVRLLETSQNLLAWWERFGLNPMPKIERKTVGGIVGSVWEFVGTLQGKP